jgi:hypothetical protein
LVQRAEKATRVHDFLGGLAGGTVLGAPALFTGRNVFHVLPDSTEYSPAASLAGDGGITIR